MDKTLGGLMYLDLTDTAIIAEKQLFDNLKGFLKRNGSTLEYIYLAGIPFDDEQTEDLIEHLSIQNEIH